MPEASSPVWFRSRLILTAGTGLIGNYADNVEQPAVRSPSTYQLRITISPVIADGVEHEKLSQPL